MAKTFCSFLKFIKFKCCALHIFLSLVLTRKATGFMEFLWSIVKFSPIKACHRAHGHGACCAWTALYSKQCAISADLKRNLWGVRTNWNNLLVAKDLPDIPPSSTPSTQSFCSLHNFYTTLNRKNKRFCQCFCAHKFIPDSSRCTI